MDRVMIETARLILRELTEADCDALYAVLGDAEIMRHYPYAFDWKRVEQWIRTNLERYRVFGFGLWAVCRKETGELIGDCGLTMQNINGFIRPEIGYHIRADHQRKGYAKEAASAVREWAFQHTPFRMLYAYMKTANIASSAAAVSIGMRLAETYIDAEGAETSVYAVSRCHSGGENK